jgi:hypothetical protein
MTLPGVEAPAAGQQSYSRSDVYPLVFNHYIDQADAMLETTGVPNYDAIQSLLEKALEFASTGQLREIAHARLDAIERMTLIYKADVAGGKGTSAGLRQALDHLQQARRITDDADLQLIIDKKIAAAQSALAAAQEEAAASEPPAPADAH